jgi:hypothetical protein
MDTRGYGKHITVQIRDWPANEPIITAAVADALADAFAIAFADAKKITNVNLKRLADNGEIARVRKGVYGRVKDTPFGKLPPSTEEILAEFLLRDDGNVIGFLAGPTLLNVIGLCSLMPREQHITTNRYRNRLPEGAPIRVRKPPVAVTTDNAPYLQAIDAITAAELYPVDAQQPETILRGVFRKNGLENDRLIWYARNYFDNKILIKTIDVALGGLPQ